MATIQISTNTNLSSLSYVQGDVLNIKNGATLLVNSTPTTRPGTIQCLTSGKLRLENSSTVNPIVLTLNWMNDDLRFEGNGVIEVRGAMMEIGTGNGSSQNWNFATLYSGLIKDLTYVEVETVSGSGVYTPWPIVEIDPIFYHLGRTVGGSSTSVFAGNNEVGKVLFWHNSTRVLSSGNNTNGTAIPNGCKIRIPNIYITNNYALDSSLSHRIISEGTPTGGTFTITIINRATGVTLGTTTPLNYNETTVNIDAAIEAVTGAGTITPAGGPLPTSFTFTQTGAYATVPLSYVVNSSVTGGTNSVIYTAENSAANLSLIDINPSGTFDAECLSISRKFRLTNDAFSYFRAKQVGIGGDAFQLNNSNGDVLLDNFSIMISPYCTTTQSQVANVFGDVKINKLVISQKYASTSLYFSALPAMSQADDIKYYAWGNRGSTSAVGLHFATIATNFPIKRPVAVGSRIQFTNLTGNVITSPKYADGPGINQITTNAISSVSLYNSVDLTISSLSLAGAMAPRNYLVTTDANSAHTSLIGSDINCANNSVGVLSPNGKNATILNYNISNLRTGPVIDQPASFLAPGTNAKKLFVTFSTAQSTSGFDVGQDAEYDLVTSNISGITKTFASVENYVGGNFCDPGLTPTTGHVTFGPIGKGLSCVMTGAAYTNQTGALLLPNNGDTAELTIPFSMHGITSFQNISPSLWMDGNQVRANVSVFIAPGIPNGGTFTLTIVNGTTGVTLGTTSALAYNSSASTVTNAITNFTGTSTVSTSGTSIGGGYTVTFIGSLVNKPMSIIINGTLLTGGAEPGVAYAYGRARLIVGEMFGDAMTSEFSIKTPVGAWTSYQPINATNLSNSIATLTGYSTSAGLQMRVKFTALSNDPYRSITQVSMPTNINPSLWTVDDSEIILNGPISTDTIELKKLSDGSLLATFTGGGLQTFGVGSNYGEQAYFVRKDSVGNILMSTITTPIVLSIGDNGSVSLFYGNEIQVAQNSDIAEIKARLDDMALQSTLNTVKTVVDTNLDEKVSKAKKASDLVAALSA